MIKGKEPIMQIKGSKLAEIAYGMSEMARTHKNDMIANNLARVSEKVAAYGASWAGEPLDDLDIKVVQYYLSNK
jgi:hypothetical protein